MREVEVGDGFRIEDLVLTEYREIVTKDLTTDLVLGTDYSVIGAFRSDLELHVNDIFSEDNFGENKYIIIGKGDGNNVYTFKSIIMRNKINKNINKYYLIGVPYSETMG